MTPEDQQIAIAQACGWEHQGGHMYRPWLNESMPKRRRLLKLLPDYLNDLNAMHEAEKVAIIGTSREDAYYCSLVDDFGTGEGCTWHKGVSATAAQRAEAFLRTLGLWKE